MTAQTKIVLGAAVVVAALVAYNLYKAPSQSTAPATPLPSTAYTPPPQIGGPGNPRPPITVQTSYTPPVASGNVLTTIGSTVSSVGDIFKTSKTIFDGLGSVFSSL